MAKVTGALAKSTEIMKIMNGLTKLPEIGHVMQSMSMEMMKVSSLKDALYLKSNLGWSDSGND